MRYQNALKGLDIPAQGNALGWYILPFQGVKRHYL